jgi:hypothetical protein
MAPLGHIATFSSQPRRVIDAGKMDALVPCQRLVRGFADIELDVFSRVMASAADAARFPWVERCIAGERSAQAKGVVTLVITTQCLGEWQLRATGLNRSRGSVLRCRLERGS